MGTPHQIRIQNAGSELAALLPHYHLTNSDERALFFRGLMAKAADSLFAINFLLGSTGPVWPLHCRWIIEAFAIASALQSDENVLEEIKRNGARTYLLIAEIENAERTRILEEISPTELPSIETLLQRFEQNMGTPTGLLYKYYRFLCEYAHFEFYRTSAYPALGAELPQDLERSKSVFLNLTVATALSLPSLAHCPPSCGFDDEHFKKINVLRDEAWRTIAVLQNESGDRDQNLGNR